MSAGTRGPQRPQPRPHPRSAGSRATSPIALRRRQQRRPRRPATKTRSREPITKQGHPARQKLLFGMIGTYVTDQACGITTSNPPDTIPTTTPSRGSRRRVRRAGSASPVGRGRAAPTTMPGARGRRVLSAGRGTGVTAAAARGMVPGGGFGDPRPIRPWHYRCLHLRYLLPGGRVLLEDASFRVGAGYHAALVGANGAGKSTLLRLVAGDLEPAAGQVVVGGRLGVMGQFIGSVRDDTTVRELLLGLVGTLAEPAPSCSRPSGRWPPRRVGRVGSSTLRRWRPGATLAATGPRCCGIPAPWPRSGSTWRRPADGRWGPCRAGSKSVWC